MSNKTFLVSILIVSILSLISSPQASAGTDAVLGGRYFLDINELPSYKTDNGLLASSLMYASRGASTTSRRPARAERELVPKEQLTIAVTVDSRSFNYENSLGGKHDGVLGSYGVYVFAMFNPIYIDFRATTTGEDSYDADTWQQDVDTSGSQWFGKARSRNTDITLNSVEGSFGFTAISPRHSNYTITPFVGMGYKGIDLGPMYCADSSCVGGSGESYDSFYRWWYLHGGLDMRLFTHVFVFNLNASLHLPVNKRVDTGAEDIELGSGKGLRLEYGVGLASGFTWLFLKGWYEHWDFDQSDSMDVSDYYGYSGSRTVYEPSFDTDEFGIMFGFFWPLDFGFYVPIESLPVPDFPMPDLPNLPTPPGV